FVADKSCLPQTRKHALSRLYEFAMKSSTGKNASILWVNGVAGTGKTFLAHGIIQRMPDDTPAFFFDHLRQEEVSPHSLFPKISRDLADFYPAWRQALARAIQTAKVNRKNSTLAQQFKTFIKGPAKAVRFCRPVLIVIDGLDE
ncbi:hypothetical protein SISNIDRAFT_396647, partial [Sistotremastrum niveocremeum HHB9708]